MQKTSYVLTEEGLKKVSAAFVKYCDPSPPSREDMANCAGLDRDTISRLLRRRPVKEITLERVCQGFGWELGINLKENIDYELQKQRTLGNRYRITKHLGNGEFSETYLAEDLHLPGNPQCLVKRLKNQSSETAKRVFDREARVLKQLGKHNQIPTLFAHFKEDEDVYLVHQFIEGHALSKELIEGQPWSEPQVIALLQDILEVLVFVHQQNVIHRDIKPSTLIRRSSDGKIVLISFGATKEIGTEDTRTIAGTDEGYRSPEQANGTPLLCSDVYAVGILGIQFLTNLHPKELKTDLNTGDIVWRDKAQVSLNLVNILDKMVRFHFTARYPSAAEALQALQGLNISRSA